MFATTPSNVNMKKEEKRKTKNMGNQYFVKYYFWISSWSYYVFYDKIKKPA